MIGLGVALLILGTALVVAEAHLPGGVLGVLGGIALVAGALIVIPALGGGALVAGAAGAGLGVAAGGWALVAARSAAGTRRTRIRAGAEGLCGQVGVVRHWGEPGGQVFVDGALWRARQAWTEPRDDALHEGDQVVVEHVNGLTLTVRRAEDWEVVA
jgi:membrane-bound serine protease (ClpP class)